MVVNGVGPIPARIMIIGEAPGETEERLELPFVGMAGKCLDSMLEEVGIRRELCYVTNVMKTRPKGNDFTEFTAEETALAVEALKLEIEAVKPVVIVALGAQALRAIAGPQYASIMDWRGSVLPCMGAKVIPTIHPASVLRNWSFRPAVVCDLQRALRESLTQDMPDNQRELVVCYDTAQAIAELTQLRTAPYVVFDIETESDQITCIGFSSNPKRAICIPFWFGASGSLRSTEDELTLWELIRSILEGSEVRKVAHNGNYDCAWLEKTLGIKVRGLWVDTMAAFHVLYPELPKSLAFLCSIYTNQPYYKYQRKAGDMDVHFRYNALDCSVTADCLGQILDELKEAGLEGFYERRVHSLIQPLHEMEMIGVKFNAELRNVMRRQYRLDIASLSTMLETEVGHPLNTASHPQMIKWLYEELKLPHKRKRNKESGKITLTADEDALDELYAETRIPAIKTVLAIREKSKTLNTYLEVRIDADQRIRTSFLLTGTETGRLSSRESAFGTGTNLQNVPKPIRKLFLADEGKMLIEADLSQAEARVVAYLAGETRLIECFEGGGDIHTKNAANIFRKAEGEVSSEERDIAKRIIHASNYGMGPNTFSQQAGVSVAEAKRLLNLYFATYPRINVWHMQTRDLIRKSRTMRTPMGRTRTFFNRWSEELYKEALAFVPQSTVADLLNEGLLALYNAKLPGVDLLLQVHDSVLCQAPTEGINETMEKVRSLLTIPLEIGGRVMTIPVTVKAGINWMEMKSYVKVEESSEAPNLPRASSIPVQAP